MGAQDVNDQDLHDYEPEWSGGATDKGPARAENQDAFWIPDQSTPTELGALYLVADGVGGQQDGALAAKLAIETVSQSFYELRRRGAAIPESLKESLERANQQIIGEAEKREVRKMGATFVAAVLAGNELDVAHVGDARAYLIRQGELRQLTRDDTWVQRQVDAGLITEEEAVRHEFRNVVTQVLGNKPEINVNLSRALALQPGDAILLCSDGLYGALPDSRLISLTSENEPERAAKLLVEAAIAAEATDNITAVVMRSADFVPMADEPTLVPLPVTMESAAAVAVPAATESAPTIMTQAPPPPPPPVAVKDKGGIPKWLIILAIVAMLLIVGAIAAFWLRSSNFAGDVDNAVATSQPEGVVLPTEERPGALSTLVPSMTIEALVPAEEPSATPTLLPDTPTPKPTPTIQLTPENRGCVKNGVVAIVWDENQVRTGDCGVSQVKIDAGSEIRILDDPSLLGGGSCNNAQFIKVQSVDELTVVGWVVETLIDPMEPGGSCAP